MLDYQEALRIVLSHIRPLPIGTMSLGDALFRTLAEDIRTDIDSPPFDRSVMDGYAVRAADTATAPTPLRVVGQIGAGASYDVTLKAGEAVQINTGAPIPAGADAVVRIEDTEVVDGGAVLVRKSVKAGAAVTRRGEYASAGAVVLGKGTVLTPVNLAAAASAGAAMVRVHPAPRVSILCTGDELVEPSVVPRGPQIRNSNRYLLEGLFRAEHCEVLRVENAGDDRATIRSCIAAGLRSDLLCITGGVSVGKFDFVPECLKELGATLRVHKVSIKPGRPTIFATMPDGRPVFALPGNPGSALVGFVLLVWPALGVMQSREVDSRFIPARLVGELKETGIRRAFLPGRATVGEDGGWEVSPLPWGGSGDAIGLAHASALIMRAPNSPAVGSGMMVEMVVF